MGVPVKPMKLVIPGHLLHDLVAAVVFKDYIGFVYRLANLAFARSLRAHRTIREYKARLSRRGCVNALRRKRNRGTAS